MFLKLQEMPLLLDCLHQLNTLSEWQLCIVVELEILNKIFIPLKVGPNVLKIFSLLGTCMYRWICVNYGGNNW